MRSPVQQSKQSMSRRNVPSGFRSIEMIEDGLRVARLAAGREPHALVLARVDLEATFT